MVVRLYSYFNIMYTYEETRYDMAAIFSFVK